MENQRLAPGAWLTEKKTTLPLTCRVIRYLSTTERTIERLRSGYTRAGRDYLSRLHDLWIGIETAAVDAAEEMGRIGVFESEGEIEIGYPVDDHEANELGFPCIGAWRQMAGRLIDELMLIDDAFDPARIVFVPRGSTPATAAAADAHGH